LVSTFFGGRRTEPTSTGPGKLLLGTLLLGWGAFNMVEGLIDHQFLGVHHVNEKIFRADWVYWDMGFLAWGAAMLIAGWVLFQSGKRAQYHQVNHAGPV
jgi:uncharacterized membrane protein